MGIFDALGLSFDVNKLKDSDKKETEEGVISKVPELSLDMSDEELLSLSKKWKEKWNKYYPEIQQKQKENEKYWIGKHFNKNLYGENKRPIQDNAVFEAVETFLPKATSKNPEPMVSADNTEQGEQQAKTVQMYLQYQADTLRLKLRIKRAVRFWALYMLGVIKISWSEKKNDIRLEVLRPHKLILDPDGYIDDDMTYTGKYIGEYKKDEASDIKKKFPDKAQEIDELTESEDGSMIQYIEWWSNEYLFWELKGKVLGKVKNPHYNYPAVDEQGQPIIDPMTGQPQIINNHFESPEKPYIFLSVFNLGKHPYDETSLVEQNLSNQDLLNKRNKQIDKNIDGMNGGWVISGENSGLTKEQSSQAVDALRKGDAIYIPSGTPDQAIKRQVGTGLPADVYNDRSQIRDRLADIFGTRGSTAGGVMKEKTVRGKNQLSQSDDARVGGGIVEYVEQFADQIFNWMVQMMYVYYDEPHTASVVGKERTQEFITLKSDQLKSKMTVSVKEGSLIPKDQASLAEQAQVLGTNQLIDPITMFDRLGFPNPKETAKRLFLWKNNAEILFKDDPEIQALMESEAEAQQQQQIQDHAQQLEQKHGIPIGAAPTN